MVQLKKLKIVTLVNYKYTGYDIGFDSKGNISFPGGSFGQNVIIFGADVSSSVHANNKTKNLLILVEGITEGLDDTTLTTEKMYPINFSTTKKKLCLSLHYHGATSFSFVNGTEVIEFKAKYFEVVANPPCLGNISEDFSGDNMKKTGYMELIMILVLIMELLQLLMY